MSEFLLQYHKVHPTTWAYLSSLLMLGLFFKFSRFWSVRNLDLVLLILLAPGLLLVQYGGEKHAMWLLGPTPEVQPAVEPTSSEPAELPLARPPRLAGVPASIRSPGVADLIAADRPASLHQPTGWVEPDDPLEWTAISAADASTAPGQSEGDGELSEPLPGVADLASQAGASDGGVSQAGAPDAGASDAGASDAGAADAGPPETGAKPAAQPAPVPENAEARASAAPGDGFSEGQRLAKQGFLMLFAVGLLVLIRTLIDPTMVRRPLLDPNLSTGGLTFIGCSLFVFLMANVWNSKPTADDVHGVELADRLLARQDVGGDDAGLRRHGPGYAVLNFIPRITTMPLLRTSEGEEVKPQLAYATVARVMAILSHLAVVLGMVAIGYRHFDNIKMGIGAATLYLMLPYTAQMTGRVDHVLPAALLVWAVLLYRRPLVAGVFIGLATGVVYYPLFLLPLWVSFYWHRGLGRFLAGVLSMLAVMVLSLAFISSDLASFLGKVQQMFGLWMPYTEGLAGIWGLGWSPAYRLPVLAGFIALSGSLAIWPAQKNLGTLLSCSAAVMVATQFWHGFGGGTYLAWYLPLILLTIFRPNLEDRVALAVLGEGWFPRRQRNRLAIRAA
ncbi:MAG: hypothetical protein J5I93_06530 [Pirellulaceae bacterium]|nr:hypothetical protein [Pirellulaceae bacterium]